MLFQDFNYIFLTSLKCQKLLEFLPLLMLIPHCHQSTRPLYFLGSVYVAFESDIFGSIRSISIDTLRSP